MVLVNTLSGVILIEHQYFLMDNDGFQTVENSGL